MNETLQPQEKNDYCTPEISKIEIDMEYGVAAGSALITPNSSGTVQTEWENVDNQSEDVIW
ncbi:hypothetical protein [Elizabethkingia anophelis]|uniref:hypothetical protein n=1 Tax=Elizabethkingia anophelis TaxID=1117645 RepID=UPI00136D6AD2|nr:hypothetical protein [Elizabethkingia anophelis]MYY43924.1 hypothetical protein [Elizabethkingia anophelis]